MRVRSADAVLDDALFIERARDLLQNRLREYTQSLSTAETTDPGTVIRPNTPPEVEGSNTATYLAFRCEGGENLPGILDAMDRAGQYALFSSPRRPLRRRAIWSAGFWAVGTA